MKQNVLNQIIVKRVAKNLSQAHMATQLNITQGYYSKIENGRIDLSLTKIIEIAAVLNIQPRELFTIPKNNIEAESKSSNINN